MKPKKSKLLSIKVHFPYNLAPIFEVINEKPMGQGIYRE